MSRRDPELRPPARAFARFAWGLLAYTVLVAVWGAFVRATGSGAGCGSHWPLCNGEILPREPAVETVIELFHRVTSGLIGIAAVGLAFWAIRRFGMRHRVTRAALVALVLTVVEGLIGAGLVRFELVEDDASVARGLVMAGHLVNTFFLLAAQALTAAWASGVGPPRWRGSPPERWTDRWLLAGALAALCLLGASGAVTALGDTLFPVATMTDQALAELPAAGRLLVRLRAIHPFLALGVGFYLIAAALSWRGLRDRRTAGLATALVGVFLVELAAGMLNVALAAPVWMQLVHLALAYVVWLLLVGLAAVVLE